MATEYISRDKINEAFDSIWDCADMVFEPDDHCCAADDCGHCKWLQTKNAIKKKLDHIHAADVRPVVRGHWEDGNKSTKNPERHAFNWWCSICRTPQHTPVAKTLAEFTMENPYCHNCGADNRLRERAEREAQRRALLANPVTSP